MANAIRGLIRSVRLHELTRIILHGRAVWVKHRRCGMDAVVGGGNLFLRFTHSGIVMFTSPAQWEAWELACFRLLHSGDSFDCGMVDGRTIWLAELPGRSLRDHAMSRTLTPPMLRAAGAELRRAHRLDCALTRRPWSHGDPHMGNMLYDSATQRARLMDFETRHELSRPADWRHADDLLTLMLELISRTQMDSWPILLAALFGGYASDRIVAELRERLRSPRPAEWLLWVTRSPESNLGKLKISLSRVIRLLEEPGASEGVRR
jgi:hypothetical protein